MNRRTFLAGLMGSVALASLPLGAVEALEDWVAVDPTGAIDDFPAGLSHLEALDVVLKDIYGQAMVDAVQRDTQFHRWLEED